MNLKESALTAYGAHIQRERDAQIEQARLEDEKLNALCRSILKVDDLPAKNGRAFIDGMEFKRGAGELLVVKTVELIHGYPRFESVPDLARLGWLITMGTVAPLPVEDWPGEYKKT